MSLSKEQLMCLDILGISPKIEDHHRDRVLDFCNLGSQYRVFTLEMLLLYILLN